MWRSNLGGWSTQAQNIIPCSLSKSTRQTYNRALRKLWAYCQQQGITFPPTSPSVMGDFFIHLACSSDRPKSVLVIANAAIACMFEIMQTTNIMHDRVLQRLLDALIKTGTSKARIHTPVMPVNPFYEAFLKWPGNDNLDIHKLRIKTLVLLALTLMLRPSDVAPKGEVYDHLSGQVSKLQFGRDQIRFETDGSLTIWFHGIKNDRNRDGFQVNVPQASEVKICPVRTLKDYMRLTDHICPSGKPVFVSLRRPFKAISSSTIAKDLEMAIELVGLSGSGYTAKCFRPTGVTVALEQGCNPDNVRSVGRWKCREVFEEHYIFPRVGKDFADKILTG